MRSVSERLHEARVGDGGRQAEGSELVGGLQAFAETRAERQRAPPPCLRARRAPSDLERHALGRQLDADALAARIAQRRGSVVDLRRGRDHVHELGFVGGRHDDEVRQAAEIGEVERAGMRRPVGADEPGAVDGEAHRQALDRDVVHDLIVGALQERRIDRRERLHALGREAGRERHRVLLGDADIERAVRELLAEHVEPGAVRHGGRDGDDPLVLARFRDEAVGEHARVRRRVGLGLHLGAGHDVELGDAVILVVGCFGRAVALALLGHDVDQDRALLGVAHVLEHRQQLVEVVAVDRARRNRSRAPRTTCRPARGGACIPPCGRRAAPSSSAGAWRAAWRSRAGAGTCRSR